MDGDDRMGRREIQYIGASRRVLCVVVFHRTNANNNNNNIIENQLQGRWIRWMHRPQFIVEFGKSLIHSDCLFNVLVVIFHTNTRALLHSHMKRMNYVELFALNYDVDE